jgi:hypothetical protein
LSIFYDSEIYGGRNKKSNRGTETVSFESPPLRNSRIS